MYGKVRLLGYLAGLFGIAVGKVGGVIVEHVKMYGIQQLQAIKCRSSGSVAKGIAYSIFRLELIAYLPRHLVYVSLLLEFLQILCRYLLSSAAMLVEVPYLKLHVVD